MGRISVTAGIAACVAVLALAAVAPAAKAPSGQLTIAAAKTTITYGGVTVITGHLTRSANAGQQVTLQQSPYPFSAFKNLATGATDAGGNYSFTVRPTADTRYRTAVKKPNLNSASAQVNVAIKVTLRASDRTPKRGQKVLFTGLTSPVENGRSVAIQRRTGSGSWSLVTGATLVDAGGGRSKFSVKLRIGRSGTYRAQVGGDPALVTGTSRSVRLKVH